MLMCAYSGWKIYTGLCFDELKLLAVLMYYIQITVLLIKFQIMKLEGAEINLRANHGIKAAYCMGFSVVDLLGSCATKDDTR